MNLCMHVCVVIVLLVVIIILVVVVEVVAAAVAIVVVVVVVVFVVGDINVNITLQGTVRIIPVIKNMEIVIVRINNVKEIS